MITLVAMPGWIPHGGGAIAIFGGAIVMTVIAAIIALEKDRDAWGWAVAAFVATFLVISAANYIFTR